MSFTLTYKDMAKPQFLSGIRKLATFAGFKDMRAAYNVAKIASLLDSEYATMEDLRSKLAKKYPLDKKPTANVEKEMQAEMEKFLGIPVEISRPKVKLLDTEGAGLSPNELLALTPMLEGWDDL